jgi:hypothetical protein
MPQPMKLPRIKHGDLLKEKNLWQVYRASWSIPDSKFNWLVGICSFCIFTVYATSARDLNSMHQLLLKLAEIGFNTAVALLGFLIAGFTIFGSLAKPDLLLTMLRHTHRKSGLSYLKYNFFTLIRTFIYFLVFAAFQLIVIVVGQREGLVAELVKWLPELRPFLGIAVRCTFVASTVLWVAAFLELKSFVFNVHHFVFTMIKFDAVKHNAKISGNDSDEPTPDA